MTLLSAERLDDRTRIAVEVKQGTAVLERRVAVALVVELQAGFDPRRGAAQLDHDWATAGPAIRRYRIARTADFGQRESRQPDRLHVRVRR